MKPKILVVEDEPAIVDTIQYALETDGFETLCTNSGEGVPALLESEHFSLIVLDIGLPDVNGFTLCKRIREKHDTPVVFLTARADEIDRVVGLEIGGDDYVVKPFSPRELCARIRAILRRAASGPRPASSPAPAGGAFQIDESRRRITYLEKALDLSRTEYEILKTFLSRPGHVFSRDRLMDAVWEDPLSSMDRAVDAHIKNIRAKLKGVRPELDPIETHRGLGYSLKEDL